MTDQEKFEQWFADNFSEGVNAEYDRTELLKAKANVRMGYLAAKQDSAAEIANLNEEIKELSDSIYEQGKAYAKVYMDKQQLQAENLKLREALEFECGDRCNAEYNPCNARETLATTPAQSLQEHDNEVIEEYKASLVPVAYVADLEGTASYLSRYLKLPLDTSLYALPKETK